MRTMTLVAVLSLLSLPVAAQSEFSVGAAVQSSDRMGQEGTQAAFGVGARLALDLWDISFQVKRAGLDKVGTPGGHQVTYSANVRHWFGPVVFADLGGHRIISDATVWTKKTWWADGGAGLRLSYGGTAKRRPHRDEIGVKYGAEVATDAVAPNRTRGLSFLWAHDLPVAGDLFLRGTLTTGFRSYLQDGVRVRGTSSSIGLGVVWRPKDE